MASLAGAHDDISAWRTAAHRALSHAGLRDQHHLRRARCHRGGDPAAPHRRRDRRHLAQHRIRTGISDALGERVLAGAAFVVSAVVAAALSRLPLPWHRLRVLRWLAGAVVVFALAEVGHIAAITGGHGGGAHTAMSLAALAVAALVALFAAYFATRM